MFSSLQMYGYTYTKRFHMKIVPDPSFTRDGLLFSLCSHDVWMARRLNFRTVKVIPCERKNLTHEIVRIRSVECQRNQLPCVE